MHNYWMKEDVDLQITEVICIGAKRLLIPSILVLINYDSSEQVPGPGSGIARLLHFLVPLRAVTLMERSISQSS